MPCEKGHEFKNMAYWWGRVCPICKPRKDIDAVYDHKAERYVSIRETLANKGSKKNDTV